MWKGLHSWENTEKTGNLWTFDACSQVLTGKRHDTTTPLYGNQTPTQKYQLPISVFLIHHVQGSFSWKNTGKIGNLWNFDGWSQILTGKTRDTTTPLYSNQTLAHRHKFPDQFFWFTTPQKSILPLLQVTSCRINPCSDVAQILVHPNYNGAFVGSRGLNPWCTR